MLGLVERSPPPLPKSGGGLDVSRRRVEQEVAALESQLEGLHDLITQGGVAPGASGRADVSTLIGEARRLREKLQDKRHELARVERRLSRERRLEQPRGSAKNGTATPSEESPTSMWKRAFAPRTRGQLSPRQRAVLKVYESATFTSREERKEFHQAAQDLLRRDENVRREAVMRVGQWQNPAALSLLAIVADDPSERVRLTALNALASRQDPQSAGTLRRFLTDRHAACRAAAVRGLGSLGLDRVRDTEWLQALEDRDDSVRRTAAVVLGWNRGDPNVPRAVYAALTLALRDESEAVRVAAVESLASLGQERGVFPLLLTAEDPSVAVRRAGRQAVLRLVDEDIEVICSEVEPEARVRTLRAWWARSRPDCILRLATSATPVRERVVSDAFESVPVPADLTPPRVPSAPDLRQPEPFDELDEEPVPAAAPSWTAHAPSEVPESEPPPMPRAASAAPSSAPAPALPVDDVPPSERVVAAPSRVASAVPQPAVAPAAAAAPSAPSQDNEVDVDAMLGDAVGLGIAAEAAVADELADAEGEEFESLFGDEGGLDGAGPDLGLIADASDAKPTGVRAVPTPPPEADGDDAGVFDGLLDEGAEPGRSAGGGRR